MTKDATLLSNEVDSKIVEQKHKKIELKLIGDHSKNKVTMLHYMGISLWLGWFSFYAYLPFTLAFLWWFSKPIFGLFIVAFVTALLLPIDRELQPEVIHTVYISVYIVNEHSSFLVCADRL